MRMDDDADYRQEEAERRKQKYIPQLHPCDPNYIGPEDEEETIDTCGRCGEKSNQEICEPCMEVMLLGAPEYRFEPDKNFFIEIGVKKGDFD